jgi:hypothetical protein
MQEHFSANTQFWSSVWFWPVCLVLPLASGISWINKKPGSGTSLMQLGNASKLGRFILFP